MINTCAVIVEAGMVVVRLDQRVPQVTVRRIADLVDGLEIRVNGLPELRHADKLINRKIFRSALVLIQAGCDAVLYFEHGIEVTDMTGFQRNFRAFPYGDIPERSAFGQMLFKHQSELFLLCQLFNLGCNASSQVGIFDLCYQFI